MTKKELVNAILKLEKVDSRGNLMKKRNDELEKILADLQSQKDREEVTEEVKVGKKPEPPKKKKIERDMSVPCRNLTSGRLTYISKKSGLETIWSEFGDEEYLEVAELLTMKSSQPKFLKEPWLFVDDEDVAEYLGLKQLYQSIIPIDEVEDFFRLSANEAKKVIPKLPKGTKTLIGEKARQGIQDGTLNNLQLVRLLEQELQLDLISLME
jgi:hypothetical protein